MKPLSLFLLYKYRNLSEKFSKKTLSRLIGFNYVTKHETLHHEIIWNKRLIICVQLRELFKLRITAEFSSNFTTVVFYLSINKAHNHYHGNLGRSKRYSVNFVNFTSVAYIRVVIGVNCQLGYYPAPPWVLLLGTPLNRWHKLHKHPLRNFDRHNRSVMLHRHTQHPPTKFPTYWNIGTYTSCLFMYYLRVRTG